MTNPTPAETDQRKRLTDLFASFSTKLELPLDFFVTVNNNLFLWGNMYLENLPKPKEGKFELSQLTNKSTHDNLYISEADLVDFIKDLDKIGIVSIDEPVTLD